MTTDKTTATLSVDVLAVMDRAAMDELPIMSAVDMKEARAAVAELIEAADQVHNAIRGHEDWGRLWSALARVKGESA